MGNRAAWILLSLSIGHPLPADEPSPGTKVPNRCAMRLRRGGASHAPWGVPNLARAILALNERMATDATPTHRKVYCMGVASS